MQETNTDRLWVTVADNVNAKVRGRAGLAFHKGGFTEVRVLLDASEAEIADRRAHGELVVGAEGYAALLADDVGRYPHAGLVVRTTPPPPPPPMVESPLATLHATTPTSWLEFAADCGVSLPRDRTRAAAVLGGPERRRLSETRAGTGLLAQPPADFATWPMRGIWNAFGQRLADDVLGSEISRLRHALSDAIPMTAGDRSVFSRPEPLPPAGGRKRWASNESIPQWMSTIGGLIGVDPPAPLDRTEVYREVEQLQRQASEARREFERTAKPRVERSGSGDLLIDESPNPRASKLTSVDQQRAEFDAAVDAVHAEIEQRAKVKHATWSDEQDRVRRAVAASIDQALGVSTGAVERFALEQLARACRDMSLSTALSEDESLSLLLGMGTSFRPAPVGAPEATSTRILVVCTRPGILVRDRAGLTFTARFAEYLVDDAQEREIRADEYREATETSPGKYGGLIISDLMSEVAANRESAALAALEKASADELQAELERRRATRSPSDGRISSRAKRRRESASSDPPTDVADADREPETKDPK